MLYNVPIKFTNMYCFEFEYTQFMHDTHFDLHIAYMVRLRESMVTTVDGGIMIAEWYSSLVRYSTLSL